MGRFSEGDRVRVDIPDETDPDFRSYHGKHGTVTEILNDNAGEITQDERDSYLYRVEFESGETMDFRSYDLRAPLQ